MATNRCGHDDCFSCPYPDCLVKDHSDRRTYHQKYYAAHRDELREYHRQYYVDNAEKLKTQALRYYHEHKQVKTVRADE